MSQVTDHLGKRGVPFEVIPHENTYSSIEEARALGIAADEVVKTLGVKTRSGNVIAVIPGGKRVDKHALEHATGDRHARLLTEEELARDFPDFELGALPPLGSLLGVLVLLDPEVTRHETVVFAAGRQTESIKMSTGDLFKGESVREVPLTHRLVEA